MIYSNPNQQNLLAVVRDKIENVALVEAGLEAMRRRGAPLTKLPSRGRSMIYSLPNGETVRVRTCNDHVLLVVADSPSEDAKLNVEGTDWLLMVMPQVERAPGRTVSYLLPVEEVEREARRTHREWLETDPNTRGQNTTWSLWFKKNAPGPANDYATKWGRFRLEEMTEALDSSGKPASPVGNVVAEVEKARQRIAAAAGVSVESVRITINFEG